MSDGTLNLTHSLAVDQCVGITFTLDKIRCGGECRVFWHCMTVGTCEVAAVLVAVSTVSVPALLLVPTELLHPPAAATRSSALLYLLVYGRLAVRAGLRTWRRDLITVETFSQDLCCCFYCVYNRVLPNDDGAFAKERTHQVCMIVYTCIVGRAAFGVPTLCFAFNRCRFDG